MTRKAVQLLVLGGLLALMVVACSCSRDAEEQAPQTPSATTPSETETPTAPEAGAPETAQEPVLPETAAEAAASTTAELFAGASDALRQLDSYRYTTAFTFVSEDAGEIETGSFEISGAVVEPDRRHIRWVDLDEQDELEMIEITSQIWIREDDEWTEIPVVAAQAMTEAILVFAPAAVWEGLYGELAPSSSFVGEESVSGLQTRHYTSTYEHLQRYWEGQLENAAGDVWIAEGGYPVKYHFTATGVGEDGERGTVTWTMELSDINADISIEPPL